MSVLGTEIHRRFEGTAGMDNYEENEGGPLASV